MPCYFWEYTRQQETAASSGLGKCLRQRLLAGTWARDRAQLISERWLHTVLGCRGLCLSLDSAPFPYPLLSGPLGLASLC